MEYLPNIQKAPNIHEAPGALNVCDTRTIHQTVNILTILIQTAFDDSRHGPASLLSKKHSSLNFCLCVLRIRGKADVTEFRWTLRSPRIR